MQKRARASQIATLIGALLVFAFVFTSCMQDVDLSPQAWACESAADCLWGQVCIDGGCRPVGWTPGSGGDVSGGDCEDSATCAVGEEDSEPCDPCSARRRTCGDDCTWGTWGDCEPLGDCALGDTDDGVCGLCGTHSRSCRDDCSWGTWSGCVGEGVCAAGDEDSAACGYCGTETRVCGQDCQWGDWSSCEGEGPCGVGDDETEPCGKCGERSRLCDWECQWGEWTPCIGEGACSSRETEEEPCGLCGTRARSCDETCVWEAWSDCVDEGVCVPLARDEKPCGLCGTRFRICTDACAWPETWSECEGEGVCDPTDHEDETCPECGQRSRTCGDDCRWAPWTPCGGDPVCEGEDERCSAGGVCKGGSVVLTAAQFMMGSPDGVGRAEERPEHAVAVPEFRLHRFEVTAGEFAAFLAERGAQDGEGHAYVDLEDADCPVMALDGEGAPTYVVRAICQSEPGGAADQSCSDHPMVQVTWYGARDYCVWAGGRLPSESEWERAARDVDGRIYPWGDLPPTPVLANCSEEACVDGFTHTAPVGSFLDGGSAADVQDLAGNAWEWVEDLYHINYTDAPNDGSAWTSSTLTFRVARGGSWSSDGEALRGARRWSQQPSATPAGGIGFRCAFPLH